MSCQFCIDPDGGPCYPQYGPAPHRHTPRLKPPWGTGIDTYILPINQWPDNFVVDPDSGGVAGTWYCPHCRDGLPANNRP